MFPYGAFEPLHIQTPLNPLRPVVNLLNANSYNPWEKKIEHYLVS